MPAFYDQSTRDQGASREVRGGCPSNAFFARLQDWIETAAARLIAERARRGMALFF
jgi:hypothetical protein